MKSFCFISWPTLLWDPQFHHGFSSYCHCRESKFDEAGSGLEQIGDDNLTTVTGDADQFLSVSFDGAWRKRGSGR